MDHAAPIAVVIVVAVAAVAAVIFAVSRKRRSETLKQHFGAEYERAVLERGDGGTEDLRQAMVHYRSLFDELSGVSTFVDNRRGVLHERAS
jgi:hypothetical protein